MFDKVLNTPLPWNSNLLKIQIKIQVLEWLSNSQA